MGEVQLNSWQSVENLVLRPPRADKYTRADLLGGPDGEFAVAGVDGASVACFRMDLEVRGLRWLHSCAKRPARPLHPCSVKGPAAACLCHGFGERFTVLHADSAASRLAAPDSSCQLVNARGQRLVASHYLPCERWKTEKTLPCVVYCHGNAGCRADANIVAFALLRRGLTCFCFDFAGSGLSDGELVTLGAHETGDLDAVVRFLRLQGRTSNIAVWGRSMGAVTAALFARTNLSIAGVVMDSPFARLTDLIRDIVTRDIVAEAPGVLVSAAILALRTSIRRRAGVDIAAIDALVAAPECYQPALFVHAREDELIYPSHSQSIAAAWAGDSRVLLVGERQSHNTLRPRHIIASCVHFLGNVLGGGLKDAEAIYMNVGDGSPPPAPPHVGDPQGVRAALLQRMWLRMAQEEAREAEAAGDGGCEDEYEDDAGVDEAGAESDWEATVEEERGAGGEVNGLAEAET